MSQEARHAVNPGMMSRRRVVAGLATLPFLPLLACLGGKKDAESSWSALPALDRINRLEMLDHPKIKDFDADRELVRAVSQFFCEKTNCVRQPEDRVSFVGPDEIIRQVELDQGISTTEAEKDYYRKEVLELTTINSRQVFLNVQRINQEVEGIRKNEPQTVALMGKRDLGTVLKKTILFHAFSHVNQSSEVVVFEDPILLQGGLVGSLESFNFVGKLTNSNLLFIGGSGEAMTEWVGRHISSQTGVSLTAPDYAGGVQLIDHMNQLAGLSPDEFIDYYMGRRPARDLLQRWGKAKSDLTAAEVAGLNALLTVGLRVDFPDRVTQAKAQQDIDVLLKP